MAHFVKDPYSGLKNRELLNIVLDAIPKDMVANQWYMCKGVFVYRTDRGYYHFCTPRRARGMIWYEDSILSAKDGKERYSHAYRMLKSQAEADAFLLSKGFDAQGYLASKRSV